MYSCDNIVHDADYEFTKSTALSAVQPEEPLSLVLRYLESQNLEMTIQHLEAHPPFVSITWFLGVLAISINVTSTKAATSPIDIFQIKKLMSIKRSIQQAHLYFIFIHSWS